MPLVVGSVLAFANGCGNACTGEIKNALVVKVVDHVTGEEICDAKFELLIDSVKQQTVETGCLGIFGHSGGQYVVTVSRQGYQTQTLTVQVSDRKACGGGSEAATRFVTVKLVPEP